MAKKATKTLRELMDLLPPMDREGWYFELSKFGRGSPSTGAPPDTGTDYYCAKVNFNTNMMACSNTGDTPEEAVTKMLKRIGKLA